MADVNLSPYTADQQAMDRRRKMAEAMQQQAVAPIEMPTVPGAKVSHLQGLAKLLQGYIAGKNLDRADQEQKDYENQVSGETAHLLRNLGQYETVPGEVISRGTEKTYPMKENTLPTPTGEAYPAVDVSAGAMPVAGQSEQRAPTRQISLLNASFLDPTNPNAYKTGQVRSMLFQYLMQQEAQKQAAAQAEAAAARQIHAFDPEKNLGTFSGGKFNIISQGKPKELTEFQNSQLQIQNNANEIAALNAQDKLGIKVPQSALQINPKIRGIPTFAKLTNRKDKKTDKPIYEYLGQEYIED